MANYDFSTLNGTDFEELACDLMNLNEPSDSPIKYKTFKEGRDKGIDFLFSTDKNEYSHVGQAKHFYETGYSGMLSVLKKTEKAKVKKLDPDKYFFFTSIDLSVSQSEEIKKLFDPYIKSLNDIYGKKNVNQLIERFPSILETHFKLWLNDFKNINKILKSDMDFRSADFVESELKKRIRLFVKPKNLNTAKKSLEENKVIIISGEPGVGKTTLAEILAYDYIAKDYKFSYVLDNIKEVEESLLPDDTKQIIYFDDFLGSNSVEINKAKGSESRLVRIVKRIRTTKNKFLILTTRSLILKAANAESDKLQRYGITSKINVLELSDYNQDMREQILKNHIEICDLSDEFKDILSKNDIVKFIAKHKNFSPRSVEFITSNLAVEKINVSEYKQFIKNNFDYPDEIWRHAYNHQIQPDDQLLINTLFSFSHLPSIDELEEAFNNRVNYEIKTNNKTKEINAFKNAVIRTDGALIIIKKKTIDFVNPSLKDFLVKFLFEDKDEINRIANSIVYVSQFSSQLFENKLFKPKLSSDIEYKLDQNYESFVRDEHLYYDYDLINLATIIKKYSSSTNKEKTIVKIINEIDDWSYLHEDFELNGKFKEFIQLVEKDYEIMEIVTEKSSEIVQELVLGEDSIEGAVNLFSELSETFQISYGLEFSKELTEHFDRLFSELIDNEVEWLKDWITNEDEIYEKKEEIEDLAKELNEIGFEYKLDLSEFDIDWWEIAMNNEFRRQMEKDD
jgi:adenylate kinase family enzyme